EPTTNPRNRVESPAVHVVENAPPPEPPPSVVTPPAYAAPPPGYAAPPPGYPPPYGMPPMGYPPPYGMPPMGYPPPYGTPPMGFAPPPAVPRVSVHLPELPIRLLPPRELIDVDLTVIPSLEGLGTPTLMQLFLALHGARVTGRLVFHAPGELAFPVEAGAPVLGPEEQEALAAAAVRPGLKVTVLPEPGGRSSTARRRDAREVVATVYREQLRALQGENLEALLVEARSGFPKRAELGVGAFFPKVDAKERRLWEVVLDGTRSLSELPAVSGLPRHVTFRLLALLMAFRLVDLGGQRRVQQEDTAATVERELDRLRAANLFDRLAAHWSDHPRLLHQRHQEVLARYAPSSRAAQAAPQAAAAIRALVEQAYEQLKTPQGRRKARSELGSIDLAAAADVLIKHAELATVRQEWLVVRENMEMAVELYPSEENKALLRDLMKAGHKVPAGDGGEVPS
ncbi:MAG: hypothetical protein AB2A00_42090, partial [Myxococcota bacterium]